MSEIESTIAAGRLTGSEPAARAVAVPPEAARRGRELARLELEEIVAKTKRWGASGRLNRGLRVSLPYFDDGAAEMRWLDLDIIPPGRVLFVPAFVVLGAYRGAQTVRQNPKLSDSTREHVLSLLCELQQAFGPVPREWKIEG